MRFINRKRAIYRSHMQFINRNCDLQIANVRYKKKNLRFAIIIMSSSPHLEFLLCTSGILVKGLGEGGDAYLRLSAY